MKTLATIFMLCMVLSATGQTKFVPRAELAFNIILVPNTFFGNTVDLREHTSNSIAYKVLDENGNASRWGLGFSMNSAQNRQTNYNFQLSFGYEKQWRVSPNWIASIGFDIPLGLSKTDCSGTFGNAICQNLHVGVGNVYGIQWMINERISVYTEGGIYCSGSLEVDEGITAGSIKFVVPQSLYLAVRF